MVAFRTQFNGYSVRFSPFLDGRLAVATAQNFGIIGNGRQHVLDLTPRGLVEVAAFDTADGLYDCAWSEANENVLVSACGDGSLKLWDVSAPPRANPLRALHEHTHEVYGVACGLKRRELVLSASWDDKVKLWSLDRPASLRTFAEHTYCVYCAAWNPVHADVFASASGDCTVKAREPAPSFSSPRSCLDPGWWWAHQGPSQPPRLARPLSLPFRLACACGGGAPRPPLSPSEGQHSAPLCPCALLPQVWDLRHPGSTLTLPAHEGEVLSCDW